MSEAATLLTLLRHGEVAGPANVLRGSSDTPLSDSGWHQMRAACATFATPLTAIAASPLQRCDAFARELAAQQLLPHQVEDDLREMNFGDWENLAPDAARAMSPELFAQFQNDPSGMTPPGGESFDGFRQRVMSAFDACVAQHAGGHVLMITHGGVMRVILASIMRLSWADTGRIALPYAGSFYLSCLAGHAPFLLNLNPSCAA